MATPGELVDAIANALGIPQATITQYDRVLAENGLRSKGGRGTSAAKVTAGDAANLLIAVLGSPLSGASIKDAARTCRKYASLPISERVVWRENFPRFGLLTLAKLPGRHLFHEGLSALIEGASKGEFFKIPVPKQKPITGADRMLGIQLDGPRPWAQIFADGSIGEGDRLRQARFIYYNLDDIKTRQGGSQQLNDFFQSRHISFKTIRTLGELLSGGHQ
jgi:hypothetical protein